VEVRPGMTESDGVTEFVTEFLTEFVTELVTELDQGYRRKKHVIYT
jgi:hypothetical protein